MSGLPSERRWSDAELAIAVAQAILEDRQNPGQNLPFQAHPNELFARLGIAQRQETDSWLRRFSDANPREELERRLAEYCWRLVGLGYLVPQLSGTWGSFHPTERGREFLAKLDPTALSPGGLDRKLADLGFQPNDLPRQYARLAQDCFLAGHYESSIVMLGVASEALVLDLAQALVLVPASALPAATPRVRRSTARQDVNWISQMLKGNKKPLRLALEGKGADADWIDPLIDFLDGTAQAIRRTRNDLGHPTGLVADQSDALQLFVLFPRFAGVCMAGSNALAKL